MVGEWLAEERMEQAERPFYVPVDFVVGIECGGESVAADGAKAVFGMAEGEGGGLFLVERRVLAGSLLCMVHGTCSKERID